MEIHETAFVVSTFRANDAALSKDQYAHLWVNEATNQLIPAFTQSVSEHDPMLHCLRNRYFQDRMDAFFAKHPNGTFINFGAGFSMYPFMLPASVLSIEIDFAHTLAHKQKSLNKWTKEGQLPSRNIHFLSADFNIESAEYLVAKVKPFIQGQATFILLEGVTFFLDMPTNHKLMNVFAALQQAGDQLGVVSYLPELETAPVYRRLLDYFDANNATNDAFAHQTIPNEFYENLAGYQLIEHQDEWNMAQQFASERVDFKKEDILNENMYLLEKI